ncbi:MULTISPECIES: phospholipase effector Tle1 domain-containing protein [unclassified Vibrio]|uniref:phospholipase effector Tle1 domain-containing protein n=2 Tax=Vibrio TaxID=662 RepID=UPI000B8E7662|nr:MULTISPECIES: DUF2235 domain-containing protein [unclassified Vibrio]NAW92085.1 DUF2235 domain-containing protein [Vibrio sp. V24_P1S3T111]OXX22896.1 hypothetical protein B9J88_08995 [Vibrio sp. V05_P4A8T149]OXX31645.1 hypothetical protein B9J95_08385 [Vibrio sp. V14_P6S14T42]OXX38301.1 hypothetical protein B9J81_02225 [Vibrio sp. V04_P4A5T148]OXX56451.1 hypothetical protein B9J91_07205 [Vibrio sp. V18_P1S4T112]
MRSTTGVSPFCAPCENRTHWIEIIIRDEFNKPFEGITGTITDSAKHEFPVVLGEAPILLKTLAPGPVTLTLDAEQWLRESQGKLRTPNNEADPTLDFAKQYQDHLGNSASFLNVTSGDLTELTPEQALPVRHQKGQADACNLLTDKSYVLKVRGFNFITLRVGMFFDGTANNSYSAQWGKTQLENYYQTWKMKYKVDCDIISRKTGRLKNDIPATHLSSECFDYPKKDNFFISLFKNDEGEVETVAGSATNELTNVQKLFDRYILSDDIREGGIYTDAVYITGIGTGNDTNIAPADESEIFGQGAGIGQYGVTAKVISSIDQLTGNLDALKAKFASAQPNTVDGLDKLQFDVFGFSRGAAAARHFINVVLDGEQGEFAQAFSKACQKSGISLAYGFDWSEADEAKASCEITFAGLFDTVASVVDLLSFDFSTHHDNGDVRLWLDPQRVRCAVHLTADPTIECRYNFSLNHLNSVDSVDHFHEFVLPGAHSDIGGGYHSRLSYNNSDYLLPILEKKLVKRASRSFSDRWDKDRAEQYVRKKLAEYKQRDLATGWQDSDYVEPEVEFINHGKKEGGRVVGRLYIQRRVEGELSRVYLRLMYGLAEFHGVPLEDYDGKIWHVPDPYAVYYTVRDFPERTINGLAASFKAFNQKVLDMAKQGQYTKLEGEFDEKRKQELMQLNVFHHSSDDSFALKPLWDESQGCYKRASYPCEKGK